MAKNLELKVVLTAIDKMTAPIRGIQKQMGVTKSAYQKDMGQLNSVLDATKNALKDVQKEQKRLESVGKPVSRELIQAEQELLKQINSTNAAIDVRKTKMNEEMKIIHKRQAALSRGKDQLRSGSIKVASAVGMTYAGVKFMQPAFEFSETMSKVQALTRLDENSPIFKQLKEQAEHLGATTWVTASQAAEAQSFYAMAGYSPEAIMKVLPSTLDLAKASGTDIARTADITSNILSAFGLDPEKTEDVADILVTAFTGSNTSLEMLGETMKYVAPVAKDLSIPLEQAAAMAGILGNVGIQDSQAGTALRKIYNSLASPNSSGLKALKKLNIATKDASGNLREVPELFADILKATKNMGNADRLGILTKLVGLEAATAFSSMVDEKNMADFEKMMDNMDKRSGITKETADTMSNNLASDWNGLTSAISGVQIAFGSLNEGPLRNLVQRITKIVQATSAWIKENPKLAGWIFKIGTGIIAATAAIGSLTMAMGLFNMFVLANPIVLVISAIIAAIGALIYFKDEIWDFFKSFADAPGKHIAKAIGFVSNLYKKIKSFLTEIPYLGPVFKIAFSIGEFYVKALKWAIDKVVNVIEFMINMGAKIVNFFKAFADAPGEYVNKAIDLIKNLYHNIREFLTELPVIGPAFKVAFTVAETAVSLFMKGFNLLMGGVKWLWDSLEPVRKAFVAVFEFLKPVIQPIIDMILWIVELFDDLIIKFDELFSFEAPQWMKDAGNWVGDAWGGIKDGWNGLWEDEPNNNAMIIAGAALTPAQAVSNNDNRTNNLTINVETRSNASAAVIATETVNAIQSSGLIGDLR